MVQQILVFRSLNFLKEPHIVASKIVFTKSWAFPDEGLLHFLTDFQGRGFVKKKKYCTLSVQIKICELSALLDFLLK